MVFDFLKRVRPTLNKGSLSVLTLFVTTKCNLRCRTCFYWRQLNTDKDDLTVEEYKKIAENIPPFQHLLVTGGEPTLKPNLLDIISIFIRDDTQTITMPTNGMQPDRIKDTVEKILIQHPKNRILIGISLDGLEQIHDEIRGIRGSFDNAIQTFSLLGELRHKYQNLGLTSLTIINNENLSDVSGLINYVYEKLPVDYISVEPLRGNPPDSDLIPPDIHSLKEIQADVLEKNFNLLSARFPDELSTILSYHIETYKIQLYALEHHKMNIRCLAGYAVAVIEPNGDFRICELFAPVGNIRNYNYSYHRILRSKKARDQLKLIAHKKCWCTHCINIGHSIPFLADLTKQREKTQRFIEMKMKKDSHINFLELL